MSEYWLARMGRNKFARYFPSGVLFMCVGTYYSYHTICKDILKQFYGYYNKSGERDTISVNLRKLIGEVYLEAREKEKLTREFFESKTSNAPSFTWFASSTLEPLNLGMTEFRTGVTIGLPYFYNYESYDDIPDHALELKKLKLFRDPIKKGRDKKENSDDEIKKAITGQDKDTLKYEILKKFDRNSEHGREFMDTLVLSDDAKRFSIARELFLADSYRVLGKTSIIVFSGLAAMVAARFSVSYFKVLKSTITVRIPYYVLSTVYGLGLYMILADSLDTNYYIKARDRAKRLGENYEKGAEEYFAKCKRRKSLLLTPDPKDNDY